MHGHGGNWWSFIRYDEEQDRPEVSRALLRRVGQYAQPYWAGVAVMLTTIVAQFRDGDLENLPTLTTY